MYLVWDVAKGRAVKRLDRSLLIIGSDPLSDVRIAHDSVAPRHALIRIDEGRVTVTDLKTATGTRIMGAALTPELPSTIDPGDFLQVGNVRLTLTREPPRPAGKSPGKAAQRAVQKAIQKAAPKAPPGPVRRAPPAAPARTPAAEFPWKAVALVMAFLFVGVLGALLAIVFSGKGQRTVPQATDLGQPSSLSREARLPGPAGKEASKPAQEPGAKAEMEPKEPEPKPKPEPETKGSARAPRDALPPQSFASLKEYPDLLEMEGDAYYPVRIQDFSNVAIEAFGSDGRLYSIPAGKVKKIEDRAEVSRRAALTRGRLAADDVDGRLELAAWCRKRWLRREVEQLVAEVLALEADNAAARKLREAIGAEG